MSEASRKVLFHWGSDEEFVVLFWAIFFPFKYLNLDPEWWKSYRFSIVIFQSNIFILCQFIPMYLNHSASSTTPPRCTLSTQICVLVFTHWINFLLPNYSWVWVILWNMTNWPEIKALKIGTILSQQLSYFYFC